PGPYLVALKVLPLFRFFRAPYRWTVGAQVALGALAALGVAGVRARIGAASVRTIATAAALALVIGSAVLDLRGLRAPLTEAAVPAAYGTLSADPQPAAVLELPSGLRASRFAAFSSLYMYYQTAHRKYLLEGTVSRLPPDRRLVVQRAISDFAAHPYGPAVLAHRSASSGRGPPAAAPASRRRRRDRLGGGLPRGLAHEGRRGDDGRVRCHVLGRGRPLRRRPRLLATAVAGGV